MLRVSMSLWLLLGRMGGRWFQWHPIMIRPHPVILVEQHSVRGALTCPIKKFESV